MTYYSIGLGQTEALVWQGGGGGSAINSFMRSIRSASNLLDAGNFPGAQGHIRRAIGIRTSFRTPSYRGEADRFLLKVINSKLYPLGMEIKYNAIRDIMSIEKRSADEALLGPLPMIGMSIIIGGTMIAGGYLMVTKILKKKKKRRR